jgi:hypothetical protein
MVGNQGLYAVMYVFFILFTLQRVDHLDSDNIPSDNYSLKLDRLSDGQKSFIYGRVTKRAWFSKGLGKTVRIIKKYELCQENQT